MLIVRTLKGSGPGCEPSSSSLLSLLLRRSVSHDAVIMKAKPMNRDAFCGSGP